MSDDFAGRTAATVERGPRHPDDRRTHTERINGAGPSRFGPAAAGAEPDIDYLAPRRAYRTIEVSILAGVRLPPGSIVHLQPHEVGAHHLQHALAAVDETAPGPAPRRVANPAKDDDG